jgi:hypothetical protein
MSPRRLVLRLVVAPAATLAVAVGLVGAPLPAHAAGHTTRDAAHDVLSQELDEDLPNRPEPSRTEGDALSMAVVNGPRLVRIRLHLAKLTRASSGSTVHVFAFRTNEGRRADLSVYVQGKRWQGKRMWSVNGRDRTCRGLRSRIDYDTATVRVAVPRRCLSNPRWVRVGGGTGILAGDRLYADDVSAAGRIGDDVVLGPRVPRG